MDMYEVVVSRSELIAFQLSATSEEDAEERYLMDGEVTASKTCGQPEIVTITRVDAEEPAPVNGHFVLPVGGQEFAPRAPGETG